MDPAVAYQQPVLEALTGAHNVFAQQRGRVLRYPPEVAPFFALPDDAREEDWASAGTLLGEDSGFLIGVASPEVPDSWCVLEEVEAWLMAPLQPIGKASPLVRRLTERDVPEMIRLVGATAPGPFAPKAFELGQFLGIEQDGELVAMGGTRLQGGSWTEISTVCTAVHARGRSLANAIVRHLALSIERSGKTPMLYVTRNNPARRLYDRLGFAALRVETGVIVRAPQR